MHAIREQTTDDSAPSTSVGLTLPAVVYDPVNQKIFATVVLSQSKEDVGWFEHMIPPICVPGPTGSTWAVQWSLATRGGLEAAFKESGICVPSPGGKPLPEDICYAGSKILASGECVAQLTNNVLAIDYFSYSLILFVSLGGKILTPSTFFSTVDPTIAVVKEPMG
jgi:hypothetical protein